MAIAYCLIAMVTEGMNASETIACEKATYAELEKDKKTVKDIHPVFGDISIIAKLECGDFEKLGKYVEQNISSKKGVKAFKLLKVHPADEEWEKQFHETRKKLFPELYANKTG